MGDYSSVPGLYSAPLLSVQQEIELVKRMRSGDSSARDTLILSNMRLVASIAKKFKHIPLEDAVMEGTKGLIKGIDLYDPSKGTKISTYATWWIMQSLRRYPENTSLVHIPAGRRGLICKLDRAARSIGPGATNEDIAEYVSKQTGKAYSSEDVREAFSQQRMARLASLDAILMPSEPVSPEQHVDYALESFLGSAVEQLSMRERYIITMRYLSEPRKCLNDVGRRLGITRERVRQLEVKALRKLRAALDGKE